ncbi:hypothetical protein [Streptomyces sp.]|uniref:hypothetical protein n=1 Tax=Streptomyces sp. TaxID=1931 RepID=UPI002F938AAA
MPFANFDDDFAEHPKNYALSDAAYRLHSSAILHCNKHLTDGLISATKVRTLVPRFRRSALDELVNAGHWYFHESINAYEVHDFLDWNRSRDQVLAARERKSKAGKKGAEKRWHEG